MNMRFLLMRRWVLMGGCAAMTVMADRLAVATQTMRGEKTKLIGPLPDTAAGLLLWDVKERGYVAEEFLLAGSAQTYESVSMADAIDTNTRDNRADAAMRSFELKPTGEPTPYVTRLVVYRPSNPALFSGNVVMETTHPLDGGANLVWSYINAFFLSRGDAYVAVQHPATLPGLVKADPSRYGTLRAQHPSQLWGMLADAGRLLKATGGSGLLGGASPRRLYMSGYSFTGVATATFANYHHLRTRTPHGTPVFDGYLPIANASYVRPLDVPVIRINTQSDFDSFGGLANRSPDSDDKNGRFRHYEVAGASHVWTEKTQDASARPPQGSPIPPPPGQPHLDPAACFAQFPEGYKPNDFPLNFVLAQTFQNLCDWVDKGVAPPRAARLEVDAQGHTRLDEHGNARGGLRLPTIGVPTAQYGVGHGTLCFLFGYRLPFDRQKLKDLYGTREQYLAQVAAASQALARARWIEPQAVDAITRDAALIESF